MDTSSVPLKQCSSKEKCVHPDGCWLPATPKYFNKHPSTKDRLQPMCNACRSAYNKSRYASDIEQNREKALLRLRDNREHINQLRRERSKQTKNRIRKRERDKVYRRTSQSLEIGRVRMAKRRARKRGLPATFTTRHWRRALEYFNNCCAVCGRQMNDLFGERKAHADHWIPLASPNCPGTTPLNIVPLCGGLDGCNHYKRDSDPVEWLQSKFSPKQARAIIEWIETYFAWVKAQEGG